MQDRWRQLPSQGIRGGGSDADPTRQGGPFPHRRGRKGWAGTQTRLWTRRRGRRDGGGLECSGLIFILF